jgi:hypothetical protein
MKQRTKKAYAARHTYRLGTALMRTLPDFLIIGAQKCGTSFLYQLLAQHPIVKPAFGKEIHYFDLNFRRGDNWYRSHFPLHIRNNRRYVTGEASPYYLFHPHAARRASTILPKAKLIVLLRNPVDRAYSHYQHQVVRVKGEGQDKLTFEEALEAEERRLPEELAKMLQDEYYISSFHRQCSYLSRGIYVDQLRGWTRFFDKTQMLVLKSEDLFNNMPTTLKSVSDFLEIPQWVPKTYSIPNKREYSNMSPATRQRLDDYFEPHNRRLYEYLGVDLGW